MGRFTERAVTGAALFALGWPIVGYPSALKLLAKRPRKSLSRAPAATVTVLLPTYNEVSNVQARLANLESSSLPPGVLDVIVIDSGSTDGTADVAEKVAADSSVPISVVREDERRGKAAAINQGLALAHGEVVVITDAPTRFAPDALGRVLAAFTDPSIGAASGWFEVTGEGRSPQDDERRFWSIRNRLRALESGLDSTPFMCGELCAFRRVLVDELDEDTLADDMNVALRVREQGSRVVVVPEARFYERRTGERRELIDTKSRRAAGGIQELIRFRHLVGRPRYGAFGMLILPSAFVYYVPLRLPAIAWLTRVALRGTARLPLLVQAAAGLAVIVGVPRVVVRRATDLRMAAFNEWIFTLGWIRVLRRDMDVRWSQERTTRRRDKQG